MDPKKVSPPMVFGFAWWRCLALALSLFSPPSCRVEPVLPAQDWVAAQEQALEVVAELGLAEQVLAAAGLAQVGRVREALVVVVVG